MNTLMRQITYLLGILVILMAGLCGYQYLAAASAARATDEQHDQLRAAQRATTEAAKARAEWKRLAGSITPRPATWSWSEQLPVMVTQLAGIADNCGAVIDTFQPSPIVEKLQLARFPLHVTMRTHLATLTKFLQQAQQATPLLAVDQLTIHAGKLPGDPLLVGFTLSSYAMLDDHQPTGGQL